MENIVWQQVDQVMERHEDICKCERCRHDIVALALNFLPPRYLVTERGETYARVKLLEQQFNIDVVTAITNAIIIVARRPRHDDE